MSLPWSDEEVELIVADYFAMLTDELRGIPINKSLHRKKLMPLLQNRTESAVEFKHQNISSALIELGLPYIKGYKAMPNYQHIIFEKVIAYLNNHQSLETLFSLYADLPVDLQTTQLNLSTLLIDAPEPTGYTKKNSLIKNRPFKIDYLERERDNQNLGELGEALVLKYEKWRLINSGKASYADTIEWTSKKLGDGLGYDILSKNTNGTDRYIEVKTTKLGIDTPIFFSKGEYEFSKRNTNYYFLYRLFNFADKPQLFIKQGSFDMLNRIEPIQFKGYP
jgi:hypothetical protein